jgi:hypothetical protein
MGNEATYSTVFLYPAVLAHALSIPLYLSARSNEGYIKYFDYSHTSRSLLK